MAPAVTLNIILTVLLAHQFRRCDFQTSPDVTRQSTEESNLGVITHNPSAEDPPASGMSFGAALTTVESMETGLSVTPMSNLLASLSSTETNTENFLTPDSLNGSVSMNLWVTHPIKWTWWRIMQLVSAVIGIVGNSVVILVVFQPRKDYSATDTLIGALAIADFLTSVFIIPIPDVSNIPPNFGGAFYCKVIYTARFMWLSVSASVFTLTAISVERYIGVSFPFKFKYLFSPRRTKLLVILIWFLAALLNSFAFVVFFVDPETQSCIIRFPTKYGSEILGISSYIFVLVIPVMVMLVTQSLTACALHRESLRFKDANRVSQASSRLLGAKTRVIKLIFIINVTFVICWAPDQTAYLAFNLGFLPLSYLYGPVDRVLVVLAFANSCINPLIYALQYPKFRIAIKDIFKRSLLPATSVMSVFGQQDNYVSDTKSTQPTA